MVTSASSVVVTWACWANDSAMRRAMVRRTPRNATRSTDAMLVVLQGAAHPGLAGGDLLLGDRGRDATVSRP